MIQPEREKITPLIQQWGRGDEAAAAAAMGLVYDELRELARGCLRRERRGHTLQATALVHELWMRLAEGRDVTWRDRSHFFGIAARLMRQVLVDHARSRKSAKRGGDAVRVELAEAEALALAKAPDLVALDDALTALAEIDPEKARIVELRFFGGLSLEEIAFLLEIAPNRSVSQWRRAKAWLYETLREDDGA